ncbi:hypothetical protein [Streptomyces sp. NPDC006333]|uniref:hypothetical protein n=1 Tax=Streptomyces sp. NPDC006333 TaxID=3156753 RepID=UPI0033BF909D
MVEIDPQHGVGDAQVQPRRPRSVLAGVGDEFADEALDDLHGIRGYRDTADGHRGEKSGREMTDMRDTGAVGIQHEGGLQRELRITASTRG